MLRFAKAAFDVTAIIHYYQPTSVERARETGQEGTAIVSPNPFILQQAHDEMEKTSEQAIRKLWAFAAQADTVLSTLIDNAAHGVPAEYEVRLPLPERFKSNPTYFMVYAMQPNDYPFHEVVETLVPFRSLRDKVMRIQEKLVVPLHSVELGFVASDSAIPSMVQNRAPNRTIQ